MGFVFSNRHLNSVVAIVRASTLELVIVITWRQGEIYLQGSVGALGQPIKLAGIFLFNLGKGQFE